MALLVVLVTVVVAAGYEMIEAILAGSGPGGKALPTEAALGWSPVIFAVILGAAALRITTRVRRARRETQELTRAATRMLRGDHEGAARALEGLVKSSNSFIAAQAELYGAYLAERRGDFAAALVRCDAALGCLSRYGTRALAADVLLPEIAATRAVALAALDRPEEAAAEIAALPAAFPFLARARFRAELYARLRAGDHAGAAAVAARAPLDLPIGPRDELARDLVRATVAPEAAGSAEIERLRDELRTSDEHRAWLAAVAPRLRAAFERATTADPSDAAGPENEGESADEEEAENEALAEAEAASAGDEPALAKPQRR